MSLYNAKAINDHTLRITKFTDDLDVEETNDTPSSYLVTRGSCECPASHRNTCRHREMFSSFAKRIDTPWFLDWDNQQWYYYHSETGQLLRQKPKPAWRRI